MRRTPIKPEAVQADLFDSTLGRRSKKARAVKAAIETSPRIRQEESAKPPQALLNVRQAAFRLGHSKSTLDKWRCAGKGPRFIRSADRAIRYDPKDLDAWIEARRGS